MFTIKATSPDKWMMSIIHTNGGNGWDHGYTERFGPFDNKEEAWTLFYALKAEDEYGTIYPHPNFELVTLPPTLTTKQKFGAAKYVMRGNRRLEKWKPARGEKLPIETKEEMEHRADISDYILLSVAQELDINSYPLYHVKYCSEFGGTSMEKLR